MDQNPQQPTNDAPPSAAQPSAAPNMPPATNYPMSSGGGMVSQDEKSQAMLMWILSIFIGFVSPLIFYLVAKDKPFVYRHSAQGLAFHLAMLAAWIVASFLAVLLIGFLLYPIIWILSLVISIMGAMAANKGDDYTPPLTGGLARAMFKV